MQFFKNKNDIQCNFSFFTGIWTQWSLGICNDSDLIVWTQSIQTALWLPYLKWQKLQIPHLKCECKVSVWWQGHAYLCISCRYPSFIQVFCYGYLNTKDFFQRDIIHVHVHILGYLNIVNVLVFNYIIFFYSLFVLSVKDLQVMSLKATRIFTIFTWIRISKCNNSFFFLNI